MNEAVTISVVVVCDDHYVILLAALIKSIETNLSAGRSIELWVVADNVTEQNRGKLYASVNTTITVLHWVDFAALVSKTPLPKDRSSYPLNIYARLFIPDLIPAHIEKVLYLDVDMIVVTDLYRLWNTDITDYHVAAVQDPRIKTFDNYWGGIINYKALGMPGSTKYFNTGLLLVNAGKWRKDRIAGQVLETIAHNIKYANYPDQYGLNIVLANRWLQLDDAWNTFVDDEKTTPLIIHFVGRKPIYKAYKYGKAYHELFYKYLHYTAWYDAKPINEYDRVLKKIRNVLLKIKGKRH